MLPEEQQQMAILKAKAEQRRRALAEGENPENLESEKIIVNNLEMTKDAKIMSQIDEEIKGDQEGGGLEPEPPIEKNPKEFTHEVELGNNKVVHIKPWTGKTRKIIKNMLSEDPEDIDINDLQKTLLRNQILESEIYLSDPEQQYLMMMLYKLSINDSVSFEGACEKCGTEAYCLGVIDDHLKYKKGEYPKEIDGITYVDIEKQEDLDGLFVSWMNSTKYDGITSYLDLEIGLHIKKDDMDPFQIQDWLDTLSIKELKKIMTDLTETAPQVKFEVTQFCKKCNEPTTHVNIEIPNVIEELIV